MVVVAEAKGASKLIYEVVEEGRAPEDVQPRWPARTCTIKGYAPHPAPAPHLRHPRQVAQAWFTEEEIPESIDLLREIQKLSLNPLAHSAEREGRDEKARPVTFFRTDRDENNNLRKVILNAILDDCGSTDQAIRLAVEWGDAKITKKQLKVSSVPLAVPHLFVARPHCARIRAAHLVAHRRTDAPKPCGRSSPTGKHACQRWSAS